MDGRRLSIDARDVDTSCQLPLYCRPAYLLELTLLTCRQGDPEAKVVVGNRRRAPALLFFVLFFLVFAEPILALPSSLSATSFFRTHSEATAFAWFSACSFDDVVFILDFKFRHKFTIKISFFLLLIDFSVFIVLLTPLKIAFILVFLKFFRSSYFSPIKGCHN